MTSIPNIDVVDGQTVTTSIAVADFFEKRHDNVVRAVRNLISADSEAVLNFEECLRKRQNERPFPYYKMDRTGFVMLGMGFTGQKAIQWRRRYIQAFDAMEAQLTATTVTTDDLRNARIEIIRRITNETSDPVRQALHQDLSAKCQQIGIDPPPLSDLSPTRDALADQRRARHQPLAEAFWAAVRDLVTQEQPINHSKTPGYCAIHMPTLRELARMNGINLGRKADLKAGLEHLATPYLAASNASARSYITGRVTRVWLFETAEFDDTPARRKIARGRLEQLSGMTR